jgi:hypothetical protein
MKRDHARSLLEQGLAELASARRHLDYSFQQVAGLPDTLKGATEKQLESAAEALPPEQKEELIRFLAA